MKKWYKQPYFDKKAWILENFDKLNLTNDEVLTLLLIEYAKENNRKITYDYLLTKLNSDQKVIDKVVAKLVEKKYLTIKPTTSGVSFDIDGIFEFDPDKYDITVNKDVYQYAEDLMGGPLSPNDLQRISDMLNDYKQNEVIDAIRVAEAYKKKSIAYVEKVLRNEK